jgi:hypothetical protein
VSIFHVKTEYFLQGVWPPSTYTKPTVITFLSEHAMKRRDEGKASLVDVMRSIKFDHHAHSNAQAAIPANFAQFDPKARQAHTASPEDRSLVRSAN